MINATYIHVANIDRTEVQRPAFCVQGQVEVAQLDLADLGSVRQLAKHLAAKPSVDVLVLNAGIMACPKTYTNNGFEMQVGTNHFGHFELVNLMRDKLLQQVSTQQGRSSQHTALNALQ